MNTPLTTKEEVAHKLAGCGPQNRVRLAKKLESFETKGIPTRAELAEAIAAEAPKYHNRVASKKEMRRVYAGLLLQELREMEIPDAGGA